MNWKTEAVEKLRRYQAMQRATVNIPREISRLKEESTALRSGLAARPSGSWNERCREDFLMDNLVTRQQLQWSLDQATSWIEQVNSAMLTLNAEERLILQQLYVLPQNRTLDHLMDQLGMEKSSIYRHRDKALRKFTLSLYGAEESN